MSFWNLVQRYIESWNRPDAELASFIDSELRFREPGMPAPGNSDSLAEAIRSLRAVMPGAKFEVLTLAGLNDTVRVQSIQRFFDRQDLHEGVGLQVIVEPFAQGNTTFGYSKRLVSGNPALPAVVGLTWIRFRGSEELDRIRQHSSQIIADFLEEPGFLSIVTGAAGSRAFTVTAWASEEAMHRALSKVHRRAMRDFRETDISPAVWTSVWKSVRTNRIWTRCPSCATPNDVADNHRECLNCAAVLPERELFW